MADLKNQVENLKMLVAAVEVDLAAKDERALVARTTEAWLLTLRENLADVEQETEKAFGARRELATLLVEGITVSRGDDGRPRVEITYRFGPPESGPGQAAGKSALGVQDSEEFAQARAEQEDANRGTGRGKTAEEINEKYDSEFVGPPL